MMVPIQPMNDEGSIQLSTLKQIIQQRKKNYNSTFLRFVWCKNSRSFFRQKSQLLTHKSFLFYSWNVVERLHSFEQIHLGTTTYLVNRHLHHSFIKKKIFRFRFLCACSLNGGNYLNYSLQRSRTQYILVIFGGRTIFLYRCFFFVNTNLFGIQLDTGNEQKGRESVQHMSTVDDHNTRLYTKFFIRFETLKVDRWGFVADSDC